MKVNFKGLYVITGTDARAKGPGDTLQSMSQRKFEKFLERTKAQRSKSGYSFYDEKNGDYYIAVATRCEPIFESIVDDFKIDCHKVGSKLVRNDSYVGTEISELHRKRLNKKRFNFNV